MGYQILPQGVLRKCTVCGKEAKTKEDLELFIKAKTCLHGRQNYCKECHNHRARLYRRGLRAHGGKVK